MNSTKNNTLRLSKETRKWEITKCETWAKESHRKQIELTQLAIYIIIHKMCGLCLAHSLSSHEAMKDLLLTLLVFGLALIQSFIDIFFFFHFTMRMLPRPIPS